MACRLCANRDSCEVYKLLVELENQLRDTVSVMDFGLVLTTLTSLEEEIAKRCRNYEEANE